MSSVSLIFYNFFYIQLFAINLSLNHHLEELTPACYFGKLYWKKNPTSGNAETCPQVPISHHRFLSSGEDYKWGLVFEEVLISPFDFRGKQLYNRKPLPVSASLDKIAVNESMVWSDPGWSQ